MADEPVKPTTPGSQSPEPTPLELADEDCPRCHAPLAHEAVMCVKCGYDLKANVIREPEIGPAVAAPASSADGASPVREFVVPGRGTPQVLATCGVFITLSALIIAGIAARQWGVWVILGSIALTLYSIFLHTCTGVVAVIAAARLTEEKFSRLELAAARMFLAISLFYATARLQLPLPPVLSGILVWAGAIGLYFLAVWFLFKKDRYGTALIALAHFLMWLLLEVGTGLAAWVAAGRTPVAPAGG